MKRIQSLYVFNESLNAGKMIFLFGPRQVGKTTFAFNKLKQRGEEFLYFNWDDPVIKKEYITNPHFLKPYLAKSRQKVPLVVFDEIHKHKNWKNILKGIYDTHVGQIQLLVMGSAMLDYFRRSGDSLIGRYFSYKMLPLGLAEATQNFDFLINDDNFLTMPEKYKLLHRVQNIPAKIFQDSWENLMEYGGFPEPFLKADKRFSVKWKRDYESLLIHEDLRDLTRIQDIKGIEQLVLLLPEKVAAPLSINSLIGDLKVAHKTVSYWLEALKKLYLIFTIMPWSASISKAIKKEAKVYFFDWTIINDEGKRFENAVAVFLLSLVSRYNELGLGDFQLRYIRNRQGEEVDFLIVKNNKPVALLETKSNQTEIIRAGHYFAKLLQVPYYQLLWRQDIVQAYPDNKYVLSAWRFLGLVG